AGPFVAINCAAIPETMLESILFGYEKGAFTGAYRSSAGKFEQANGGTLLLDEVSEMDIALQAKLLRVLQEKEVDRLGGEVAIPIDVRIIATTNRDLRSAVAQNQFRKDLYYRLNVLPLHLPPLRERIADIVPLTQHFLGTLGEPPIPELDASAIESLLSHTWPGNVRELENVVQRALIMRRGASITEEDLQYDPSDDVTEAVEATPSGNLEQDLRQREQRLIVDAIQAANGNRQNAARRLGISPRTLRHKVARYKSEDNVLPALARL
ncbi:MAG: sigma-54 dependent transcriptional regulator, partial [Pseudomonadota bacterium]